jgi:flagellar hook-basal body complex protein FliE
MVNGIGSGGGGIGRQAIDAAIKGMQSKIEAKGSGASQENTDAAGFADMVKDGIAGLDNQIQRSEQIHLEAVSGNLDLHEVAAQLKESNMSFQFAMQVRNKFVDAYREVMRMSV